MSVMQLAGLVWLLAAGGGVTMAWMRIGGRPHPPVWLAVVHGALALAGLGLAAWSAAVVWELQHVLQNVAVLMGVVTASGGLTLALGYHARGRPLPLPIVIVHGMLGAITVVVALVSGFADTRLDPFW